MLVLVSVDGLRPELYLGIPQLRNRFAYAQAVVPVYPSLTYTNHATLVTGVSSSMHGVFANTKFVEERVVDWVGGESQDWQFDSSAFRVPTLWDVAAKAGLRTALIRWPTTLGARATWLVPEVFPVGSGHFSTDWEETWPMTTQAARLPGFQDWSASPPPTSYLEMDKKLSELTVRLARSHAPDLILLHLAALDHATHQQGIESAEVSEISRFIYELILGILDTLDLSRDQLMLVGDHGFSNFRYRVHINALLAKGGWLRSSNGRIAAWTAVAHTSCAQAAVYLRQPSREEELLAFLRAHQSNVYRVLGRERLRQLGAFPDATCAIDAREGFSMGQELEGPWITKLSKPRSEHGYLPDNPAMHTGFLAAGKGIMPGLNLGVIDIRSITPTICALLGLRLLGELSPLDLANSDTRPLGRTIPL